QQATRCAYTGSQGESRWLIARSPEFRFLSHGRVNCPDAARGKEKAETSSLARTAVSSVFAISDRRVLKGFLVLALKPFSVSLGRQFCSAFPLRLAQVRTLRPPEIFLQQHPQLHRLMGEQHCQ